jgi:hypothetical protein
VKQRYTYEIETSDASGRWSEAIVRDDVFSRDAMSVARALLESWVIDHPDRVTGGERILIRDPKLDSDAERLSGTIRVRVFRGDLRDHAPRPEAIGYLGHDDRDFTSEVLPHPMERVYERARTFARHERVRRARAMAKRAAKDPRVGGATAVAAAATVLGYLFTRRRRRNRSSD